MGNKGRKTRKIPKKRQEPMVEAIRRRASGAAPCPSSGFSFVSSSVPASVLAPPERLSVLLPLFVLLSLPLFLP